MADRTKENILRRMAESLISQKKESLPPKKASGDMEKLIHELMVHQVELEMQNDELRKAQEEIEASRSRYVDIYDFAPVGYFALDEKSVILEANLTGAKLLGTERKRLLKVPFSRFIISEDQDLFREFQRTVFRIPGKHSCELGLKRTARDPLWVGLEGVAVEGPDGKLTEVRLILSDIAERKKAEKEVFRLNAELEAKVTERTAQLEAANKALKDQIARQEQAEEETRRSEREFRGIFELSSVGMAERDAATGQRLHVNQRLCEMTGYSAEELLNGEQVKLTHPDDWQRDQEVRAPVLKGESDTWIIEKRYVRKNGGVIWVLVNGNLIRDSSGRPLRTVAVIQDITERKHVEQTLRESQNLLRAVMETTSDPVYVKDRQSRILMCNPALEKVAGRPAAQIIGRTDSEYYDDLAIGQTLRENDLRVMESGRSQTTEEIAKTPDGLRTFISNKAPYRSHSGEIIGIVGISHDITERKRAEEGLRKSEAKYRHLFQNIQELVMVGEVQRDDSGHIVGRRLRDANPAVLRAMGVSSVDEIRGKTPSEVAGKNWSEWQLPLVQKAMDTGQVQVQEVYRPESGQHYITSAVRLDADTYLGTAWDITECKRAEEVLRRAKDELEVRVQERTEELLKSQQRLQQLAFQLLMAQEKERKRVAIELHDGLLSELAATKYLLEGKLMLLERGKLLDLGEFKRVGDTLAIAMKEARRIMNNLHPSVLDELGLIAALKWSCGEYQKSYPHIKVETKIQIAEQDISESIRVVIYRVLQEALNNFARHGEGDLVELSLLSSDGVFAFQIRDNGQGFDLETVQKGLGLESMKERVELSGGRFQIESTIGQGTTIRAVWSS